ncbi:sodium channel protein Nach-like [Manduca sexta]|uniref:sodium channel protein Nach-like n=1 Tax=Manduca sexta TaxID=7130 RepID=UPI00189012DB|nr:sodium channel protein Nach-like [Manduca sexta]
MHVIKWWALALSLLFACSVTVVLVTVNRFMDNPTFLVQQETIYSTMSFPSVLVCPEITFHDDKIDQFVKGLYVKDVIRQLAAFFSPDVVYQREDLENIEHFLRHNGLEVDAAGRKLMTTCEETLIRCRWNGKMVDCSMLFQMELTGDGYCCVFNGRSLSREIVEYGIHGKHSQDEWLTSNYGHASGLMLVVNQTQKLDNVDLSYKWIALQSSQHYVETTVNGTPLNPGSEQWARYTFQGFQIAYGARSLSDRLRRCRMADQPLKLFPTYHRDYCLVECELERTLKRCNCARAVHPKPPGIRYCKTRNLLCAKHAMISSDTKECNCPQACDVASDVVQTTSFGLMPSVQPFDTF